MTAARDAWNKHIHAFVALSEAPAKAGPLGDLTVGVKDNIDVAGLPTRNGSAACANALPAEKDATVVQRLRDAGARIIGKTTTTEFAFTDPTSCRNPHDLARSPGGSSSGSGAAVGAGILDFALGTQTAGSLIRPAAYCGAVGFKPSIGLLPMDGVTPLASSFDTVGIIARNVDLARRAFAIMAPSASITHPHTRDVLCGLWDTAVAVPPDWMEALDGARNALAGFSDVAKEVLPTDVDTVVKGHRIVMCAEAYAAHRAFLDEKADILQPRFRAGLEAGRTVDDGEVAAARDRLTRARLAFWKAMTSTDLILTLPVPEGAPLMVGTTGYQDWLTPWTAFGGPLVCLPWGIDALSRPRSIMLAAHPGQDEFLLTMAACLEAHAPTLPAPQLPL
ncbi:amidase [uncultured Tateyamaria sp.]|uniref:amidase n=1 Tax=uncultured Tateyamaria sp. TaxID=455651 RepID=UPI00260E7487|nr:amidase [uncultured Tateyamaria sp.]